MTCRQCRRSWKRPDSAPASTLFWLGLALLAVAIPVPGRSAENPRVIAVVEGSSAPAFASDELSTLGLGGETQRIDLWLEAGDRATSPAADLCAADGSGNGDEVCAFTIVIEAVSGMIVREESEGYHYAGPSSPTDPYANRIWTTTGSSCPVAPSNFQPDLDGLVSCLDAPSGTLTLVWLGGTAPIGATPTRLGSLLVELHSLEGELRVRTSSEAVSAGLDLLGVNPDYAIAELDPDLPVPEAGLPAGLIMGGSLLLALARRRRRVLEPKQLVLVAAAVGWATVLDLPAEAQFFSIETGAGGFVEAVEASGGPLTRLTFDDGPAGGGSYAFSNGDRMRQVTFESLTHPDPIALSGAPSMLIGSFLVEEYGSSGGEFRVWPGGRNIGGGDESDDDARISFDFPVRAAGVRIDQNSGAPAEFVRFEDAGGNAVHEEPIPPGSPVGFFGYVVQPGDRPIVAIVIEESDADASSLAFDDVYYETGGADPFADVFRPPPNTNIVIDGLGQPAPQFRDPNNALGPNDNDWVSLGLGGRIELAFTDGRLLKSGNDLPDLKIYEPGIVAETFDVALSANGVTWYVLDGPFVGTENQVRIDLDATVGLPNHRYRFVRITDLGSGLGQGSAIGIDVDAVEILSGKLRPPDADFDGVANSWDNCPDFFNPDQAVLPGAVEGSACVVPARVILERDPAVQGSVGRARLKIECGSQPVERVLIGIWRPPETGTLEFGRSPGGGSCGLVGDPPDAVAPGLPPDGRPGCTAGVVGPTVDAASSGVFGSAATGAAGFTTRSDVVYLTLYGAAPSGYLCNPDNPMMSGVIDLIEINTTMALSDQTQLISVDSTFNFQSGEPICATCNSPCEELPADVDITTALSGDVTLSLVPLLCDLTDPGASQNVWSLWANAPADFIYRASLGFLGPEFVTQTQLRLDGCVPNVGCGPTVGEGEVGDPGDTIDEESSYARGPEITGDPDLLRDALYAVLAGGVLADPFAIVPRNIMDLSNLFICIGEVENNALVVEGAPPIPVRDGLLDLDYASYVSDPTIQQEPFLTLKNASDPAYEPLPQESVGEAILFNGETDLDSDDVIDAFDTCPFFANPAEADGQLDANFNGIGDECDCGDVDASLAVGTADVDAVLNYLLRGRPAGDSVEERCSISEGEGCDTLDAYVLKRFVDNPLDGFELEQRCDAALP